MNIGLNEFLNRAVQQTILALAEPKELPNATISASNWFRASEAMVPRPRPRMLEYYENRAPKVGLIIPFFLNHLFEQHRETGKWFVLYNGDSFDLNVCYLLQHQLRFVVSEHDVISVVQAFIAALHQSPYLNKWRGEGMTWTIDCPNGAVFTLYNHNGSPGFRSE